MKKILTILAISLVVLVLPSVVLAQGGQDFMQRGKVVVEEVEAVKTGRMDFDVDPEDLVDSPKEKYMGAQAGEAGAQAGFEAANKGIETGIRSLNRVVERANNPEVGEQVRTMVQSHEEIQVRTETALKKMAERSKVMKLVVGPDYKNAGEVRSDVVGLRNDIKKLESMKGDAVKLDADDIQSSIEELKAEADGLEADLTEQLSGFSLFGWLARLLN